MRAWKERSDTAATCTRAMKTPTSPLRWNRRARDDNLENIPRNLVRWSTIPRKNEQEQPNPRENLPSEPRNSWTCASMDLATIGLHCPSSAGYGDITFTGWKRRKETTCVKSWETSAGTLRFSSTMFELPLTSITWWRFCDLYESLWKLSTDWK